MLRSSSAYAAFEAARLRRERPDLERALTVITDLASVAREFDAWPPTDVLVGLDHDVYTVQVLKATTHAANAAASA